MTFEDIEPYMSILLSHQRSFLQLMGITTVTHKWTMWKECEILEHSVLNMMSSPTPFPQASRTYAEEEALYSQYYYMYYGTSL